LIIHIDQIGLKKRTYIQYGCIQNKNLKCSNHLGNKVSNNSFQIANVVSKTILKALVGNCVAVEDKMFHNVKVCHSKDSQLYAKHGLFDRSATS